MFFGSASRPPSPWTPSQLANSSTYTSNWDYDAPPTSKENSYGNYQSFNRSYNPAIKHQATYPAYQSSPSLSSATGFPQVPSLNQQYNFHTYYPGIPPPTANHRYSAQRGAFDFNNVNNDAQGTSSSFYCNSPKTATDDNSRQELEEQYRDYKVKPDFDMMKSRKRGHDNGKILKSRQRAATCIECVFCKNNDEDEEVYKSHVLKDPNGDVICPVLRYYNCPICKNGGGKNAHTIRYCPKNRPFQQKCLLDISSKEMAWGRTVTESPRPYRYNL